MKWLTDVGLGLDYDALRLDRTNQQWIDAGSRLRNDIAQQRVSKVASVEQIGSSSVIGLLAKPIVDLAVGLTAVNHELPPVHELLEATGWTYRSDAIANGGHVFVLEAKPWHRVAHLHVVDYEGEQWRNYLRLRDLLRQSQFARARYESVKWQLTDECGHDRKAYTDGKSIVIGQLIDEAGGVDVESCRSVAVAEPPATVRTSTPALSNRNATK